MHERSTSSVKQETFTVLPVFSALELLGMAKPAFTPGSSVEVRRKTSAIRTNVSDLEVLLPFFLDKMGLIEGRLEEHSGFTADQASTIIGTHLHRIDSLLSAITQGRTGILVDRVFPTHMNQKERDAFSYATEIGDLGPNPGRDELVSAMTKATRRFKSYYLEEVIGETWQESFLPDTKSKALREKEILTDGEVEREEDLLIAAWAREIFSADPMSWEFAGDVITQREVNVVLNLTNIGLQFTGRLDSIARKETSKKLVVSQIVDFKTGRGGLGGGLAREVSTRQVLMMRVMAEWFTAAKFAGKKSLLERTSAFIFTNNEGNTAAVRRLDMFAYRRFGRKTGEMRLEPAPMDLKLRLEIDNWLKWYSGEIHKHETEVRALIKNRTQYDISKLELKKP